MIHWRNLTVSPPDMAVPRAHAASWLPRRTSTALTVAVLAILDMLAVLAVLAVLGALVMPALASS